MWLSKFLLNQTRLKEAIIRWLAAHTQYIYNTHITISHHMSLCTLWYTGKQMVSMQVIFIKNISKYAQTYNYMKN